MMDLLLKNLKIMQSSSVIESGNILITDGIIASVSTGSISDADRTIDYAGHVAAPGYIDSHCHGAIGFDCNDGSSEALSRMNAFYGKHGYTSYYPTLSVDPLAKITAALECIRESIRLNRPGSVEILGTHFESPFINVAYKGCQAADRIMRLNDSNFEVIRNFKDVIRRITVAPELDEVKKKIRELVDLGIVVSGGHSGATFDEVIDAQKNGLRAVTHLYNAMSSIRKNGPFRELGMLEASLACDDIYTEIIADGYHVPWPLMRIALKCKGEDKVFICSDANRGTGLKDGSTLFTCGQEVIVENGIAMLKDRSSLASSVTPMDTMVRNLISFAGIEPRIAIKMASTNVARMMMIDERKGSLEPGKDADINILDRNYFVKETYFLGCSSGI